MEKFLTFCDKHNLSFEIHFRPDFRDPDSRFFLTFGSYADMHTVGENDDEPQAFHFSNGNTPQKALENAISELDGCCLQFKTFDGHDHVSRLALFKA